MKRFGKILVVALALCLLVGALALAISANTDPAISGKYVVKGVGYNDWSVAVSAAGNGGTVYINEDNVSIDATIEVSDGTSLTVNLNGHTVASNVGTAFSVTNGTLTLAGSGIVNNVGTLALAVGENANLVIDATEGGIVVNHKADLATTETVRAYDRSNVTVKGKIIVNTVNSEREIFDMTKTSTASAAAKLTFDNANVHIPAPTTEGMKLGIALYIGEDMNVNIQNSTIEINFGKVLVVSSTNYPINVGDYLNSDYTWKDASEVDYSTLVFPEPNIVLDADNSTLISRDGGYTAGTAQIDATVLNINASKFKGTFDNCVIIGESRAIETYDYRGSYKKLAPSQLIFNNSHILHTGEHTANSVAFCYGVNFKINGGSVYYRSSLSAGSLFYKELGNGKFAGAKMDNVLLGYGVTGNPATAYSDWGSLVDVTGSTRYEDTIKYTVNGVTREYTAAYFSNEALYKTYLPDAHWVTNDDGNVPGCDFYKAYDETTSSGTLNFSSVTVRGKSGAGEIRTEYSADGNGYLKFSYKKGVATTDSDLYDTIGSVGGNIHDYDFFVMEFDVATLNGEFPTIAVTLAGRSYLSQLGAGGTVIQKPTYATKPVPPQFRVANAGAYVNNVSGTSVDVAVDGSWNRITLVVEVNISDVDDDTITVPTYSAVGTLDGGSINETQSGKTFHDYRETKLHYYVNGQHIYTYDWGNYMGYNGIVIDGDYVYNSGLWFSVTQYASDPDTSVLLDNIRYSRYAKGTVTDSLGLYTGETLNKSIVGNSNFHLMPDNNVLATVNGTPVYTEAALASAITKGAKVELKKNLSNILNIDKACTIDTNGLSVAGFASATHKAVNYDGVYHFTAASASEIYTVNYTFGDVTKTVKAALGTTVVHPEAGDFGGLAIIDGKYYTVTGCQLIEGSDVSVVSDYYLTSNTVNAVVLTEELDPSFIVGNNGYETLADAVANANGAEIKLVKDITLSALDGVTATTYAGTTGSALGVALNITDGSTVRLNLNGKTITQDFDGTLFNVTNGTLELIGEAKFASLRTLARATGENSNINIKAYGTGFDIDAAAGSYALVIAETKANLSVTGNMVYTPTNDAKSVYVFKLNTANNITFHSANVTYEGPSAEGYANQNADMMLLGDSGAVTIANSNFYMVQGDIFTFTGKISKYTSVKDYLKVLDATAGTYYPYFDKTLPAVVNNGGKLPVTLDAAVVTINATNSSFVSTLGEYGATNQGSQGGLMRVNQVPVHANFTGCDFVGNNRPFTGGGYRVSHATYKFVTSCQLKFNDCNYTHDGKGNGTAASGHSENLFCDNVNVDWNGGYIKLYGYNLSGNSWGYNEVTNGFIGVRLTNVYSATKLTMTEPTTLTTALPSSGGFTYYASLGEGVTYKDKATVLIDGNMVKNVHAYTDGSLYAPSAVFYSYSFNDDSADYVREGTAAATGTAKYINSVMSNYANAAGLKTSEISTKKDGNGYVKFEWNPKTTASSYFNIWAAGGDTANVADANADGILNDEASKKVSNRNLVDANYKYQVVEYDLKTDSQLPDLVASLERRALASLKYDAQGNLTQANRATGSFGNINFYPAGGNSFLGEAFTMKLEPHSWYRITIVLEVSYKESTKEVVTGVSVPSYDFSDTKAHLYINGELMVSAPLFATPAAANIDQRVAKSYAWTELRFTSVANKADVSADVGFDNVHVAAYAADPGIYGADSKLLTTLTENDKLLSMPYNNIAVDGIGYANAEAAAAAIKTGSLVELRSDVNAPIAISGAKSVTVKTNGYNFAGFVSADTKVLDYSAIGYYYTDKALEGEIYTLVYGTVGGVTNESTTAAAGTVIAPTNAITAAPEFAPETEQYKNYLGWSFYENKVVTAVPYANGKTTLNVVGAYEMVDAVKVLYKNGDAVLDTEYYFPGASDKLNEYNGPAIATDDTPVWYSVGFVYWDESELDLSTPGTYEVNAFIGKLNPDANTAKEVGMQFNLTLYNNSELNVYIPVVDTITNLEVYVVTDSGEYLIDYIMKGTIKGEEYYKYSYTLGTADTRILDFKVSYKIGTAALSYTFEYGIPSYANAAMTQISDTDTNGVVAKALVMNMVNYANKVLAVMGETGDSVGAEIYANLIATYATEGGAGYNAAYLAAFNALEDTDFLAGGDIYVKDGVADINWNDPENAASQYVAGISFVFDTYEPCFVLEYSDAAIAKGIQRPDGGGSSGYFNGGVFAYAGYTGGPNTVSVFPVAFDKDGNKLTRADAVWYSFDAATGAITNNTNAENSYFAYAKNAYANHDKGSRFSISNLLNGVSFSILVGGEPALATDPETGDLLVNAEGENYYRSVPTSVGTVEYNLSAYINSLLTADNAADNADEIAAAKALYAFSQAAGEYVKK